MKILKSLAVVAALASGAAAAQTTPPPVQQAVASLGLDAARSQQVLAILAAQHEKVRAAMEAARAETDAQLATILTAEQVAALRAAMPAPRHGPRGEPL